MRPQPALSIAAPAALLLAGAGMAADLRSVLPTNPFAYIPPQCYTRTTDAAGAVHNPCYTCHVAAPEPNFAGAPELQTAYDFAAPALTNPWTNLFVDRRPAIAAMTDADTLAWVRTDNYHATGGIALAEALAHPPSGWDIDGDGAWSGYVPDIWFDFDAAGYDVAPDGARTGWRAFAYHPLPGAFWPSNGSADDVAIRLPEPFRERADGTPDGAVYAANLAIVEALVKRADVPIPPTDETAAAVDLDRDGTLGTATRVAYAFDPRNGVTMRYAGRAGAWLDDGRLHLAAGLYPEGTEFVHSVRYLDVGADGRVGPAARLKELRYARKTGWRTYWDLRETALRELREEVDFPDRPERHFGDVESGISTGQGWRFQGFIEAADGSLRPQTFEESLTCAGCHAGVGRTVDDTFSYPRKIDAAAGHYGWYPWSTANPLGAIADRMRPDGAGEYATYLVRNGAGDEFRANADVIARYLDAVSGEAARADLSTSVEPLVTPTPERALMLDKAYRILVGEQSYAQGRTPVVAPLDATVHRRVTPGQRTGITVPAD